MEPKDIEAHKAKLIQQRTQLLAQIALLRTDLDMLTGAIQSVDVLIKEATPKETTPTVSV